MSALLSEGTLFAGRYRILRIIAQGGMGSVYEVVHTETNRHRALKVMHPHLFQSDDLRDRFKREARLVSEIESEHVVDVSDAGIDEATQTPFMVMELLRGEELGKRIKRAGRFQYGEALIYLRQTSFALDRTHEAHIVHRDLKPENLFYTQHDDGSPRIKILDFGVAKLIADGATGQATQSLGTPLYMAPEQFLPGAKITPAADIFALGMLAFTMLVGVPYWQPESKSAGGIIPFVTIAVAGPKESAVIRAASQGVALPPAFDAWFARATAPNPAERFSKASEAIAALEKVYAEASAEILSVTVPLPARPPAPSVPAFSTTPGTLGPVASAPAAVPTQPEASPTPSDSGAASASKPSRGTIVSGIAFLGLLAIGGFIWTQAGRSGNASTSPEAIPSSVSTKAADAPTPEPALVPRTPPVVSLAASEYSVPVPETSAAPTASTAPTTSPIPPPVTSVVEPKPSAAPTPMATTQKQTQRAKQPQPEAPLHSQD